MHMPCVEAMQYIRMCVYARVHIYIQISMYTYIHMVVNLYIYIHTYICVYRHVDGTCIQFYDWFLIEAEIVQEDSVLGSRAEAGQAERAIVALLVSGSYPHSESGCTESVWFPKRGAKFVGLRSGIDKGLVP